MKTVQIEIPNQAYLVHIGGEDALAAIHDYLDQAHKVLVVTDQTVASYHLQTLQNLLSEYSVLVYQLSQTPEQNKQLSDYSDLLDYAIANYLDRYITVIAFGGGAVGDFAGYFAATYKRGVKFIQMPTTLLAHDSSVGGKVALNHHAVKNVIGSFYQPRVVLYHVPFLKTLPKIEVLSGFAEIIKHDLLSTGKLLENLTTIETIFDDDTLLADCLADAIETKYQYIKDDIHDVKGKRQFLNLGHTVGHALEVLIGYTHGEAILFGICFDLFLKEPLLASHYYTRFKALGYFNVCPRLSVSAISDAIKHDKKNRNDRFTFIGLDGIGNPYEITLTALAFQQAFRDFINLIKW